MSILGLPEHAFQNPGPADPAAAPVESLHVFDDPEEWSRFSHPGPGGLGWVSQVRVEGMYCAACSLTVEQALLAVPGVCSVKVSSAAQRASVQWDAARTRPSQWLAAAQPHGYRLVPDLDVAVLAEDKRLSRLMLWRWLVAGFCMMQVMMYAYPAYIAEPGSITPDVTQLLRWASWVLSLPVLLFSSQPFLASAWRDLRHRRISMDLPVSLGILITFALSSAATFEPQGWWGGEVYFDSFTMFVFFLLSGRWLEQRLRERTAGALDALMQRLPHSVQRQRAGGGFEAVAVRRLRVGDVIQVRPGEAFAADGVLVAGQSHVDESLLTGESRPLPRSVGEAVMAGSHNLSTTVLVQVQQMGEGTRYGGMVRLMQQAAVDKPALAQLADRVARPFLWGVLVAAAAAAAWWWPTDPARGLLAAAAVLVVTCPCALSLATPSALLSAAGWLARQGLLVRRLQALESLQSVDTVLLDKTGTLTEARMGLREIRLCARNRLPAVGPAQALSLAAALARQSLHPVSRAVVEACPTGGAAWSAERVLEVAGQGLEGRVAGAAVLGIAGELRLGRAAFCRASQAELEGWPDEAGMRVCLADAQGCIAVIEFDEQLRADAATLVARLQAQGLEVQLLSGDRPAAVQRVAQRLGVAQARGDCTPQDKLAQLEALQAQGRKVLMVGDGLNDGPVLARAHVSMAVGASVPLAQAQADLVMPAAPLVRILDLLAQARRTQRVVRQNLAWSLLYNAVSVPLALTGSLPAWLAGLGMALSSLLVVLNAARLTRAPGGARRDQAAPAPDRSDTAAA